MATTMEERLTATIGRLDRARMRDEFLSQGGFVARPGCLPQSVLAGLLDALPGLRGHVHRSHIPGHKRGGSIGCHVLQRLAPVMGLFYRSGALRDLLSHLSGQALHYCPAEDPHAFALYYYTEPGDHIGYHYDRSYYRGARYTVLLGLVDRSGCRLEYQLHRKAPRRATRFGSLALAPGTLVVFDGDSVYHRVTPLGRDQQRIVLSCEYVSDRRMHPLSRFVSQMKDALAYFGLRQVFGPGRGRP